MSRDERISKSPGNPSFRMTDPDTVRSLMRRVPKAAAPAHKVRIGPTKPVAFTGDVPRLEPKGRERPDDSLLRDQFLQQLQRERRRADRTKAPLSIVLFRFDGAGNLESENVQRLFDLLQATRRETDILGRLSENLLGVLLPDTNKQGARVFMEKILRRSGDMHFSTIVETYPDHLFDNLLSGLGTLSGHDQLVVGESGRRGKIEDYLKRTFDITFSIVLITAAAPLMLVTAIAIKWTSPGPVIFKQKRLGHRGAPFDFYKFRSMNCDSDDRIHREFVTNLIKGQHDEIIEQDGANPLFKIKSDPRVTLVGKIIRQTSIDELPQLFNVVKGDMSLVGPRPPLPYEAAEYQSWHLRRILDIRPGITGVWQVEGRSKVSFDEMVRMDLRYIKDRSFTYDLKLLLKTVTVVLRQDGAK